MQVICSCNKERVSTRDVEFLYIEEGLAGEDRMKFVCPACGEDHTSVVLAGESCDSEEFWDDVVEAARASYYDDCVCAAA